MALLIIIALAVLGVLVYLVLLVASLVQQQDRSEMHRARETIYDIQDWTIRSLFAAANQDHESD